MMNRTILSVALGTALLAGGVVTGRAASDSGPTPAPKQQKLYKIATIRGANEVRAFEHNVQVMQAERQAAIDLQDQVDKEKNAGKKKELQTKLDAALKKLNEDNAVMAKTYGFSLARNYNAEIEALNIYLQVTDEEARKIEEQANQEQQKQASKK